MTVWPQCQPSTAIDERPLPIGVALPEVPLPVAWVRTVFDGTYGLQPIEGIAGGTLAEVERFPDLVEREFWFGCYNQESEDPAFGGS